MLDLPSPPKSVDAHISSAVIQGEQRFGPVKCPLLAIFAYPHDFGQAFPGLNPSQRAALGSILDEMASAQVNLFELTYPNSGVVVLPHASHYVFVSNEAYVLREIDSFAAALK